VREDELAAQKTNDTHGGLWGPAPEGGWKGVSA
jgi:hypothetical protein